MFDIGWSELLVIAVVLIVVVGPKDLPPMLRAFGKTMTRFRKVAGEFRAQFDEALREADLDDVRQTIADAQKLNPAHSLREAMNPLRQMGNDIKADLQRSTQVERLPEPQMLPLAETPPVEAAPAVAEPQPVIAPPPAVIAETVAKPKAVRKPRAKSELIATEPTTAVDAVEGGGVAKALRKPRVKTEALSVDASVPVVTEVLSTSKPAQPRAKRQATAVFEPSVVEPAQVGLPDVSDRPKRATGKPVVPIAVADTPAAAPKKAPARKSAPKKDDA
jgi:sec-independent protein translocase protein TatB